VAICFLAESACQSELGTNYHFDMWKALVCNKWYTGWMMGSIGPLIIAVLILGAAALVKYLFFSKTNS
jgi:hypothetical protein